MISIVIPTLNRGQVLIDTISYLLALSETAAEIIVVDQTLSYSSAISEKLTTWHSDGDIRWIKEQEPSVVKAMNIGLCAARSNYVLFLDDDIKPFDGLVAAYKKCTNDHDYKLIAGRVVQPWDNPDGVKLEQTAEFSFNSVVDTHVTRFMGGNFLLDREVALTFGGFDENFKGSAHDYEREFSDRLVDHGLTFYFCANAGIYHLKEPGGGIRSYGHFLKTIKPHHALGAYYYVLRSKLLTNKLGEILKRMRERVLTRTHLKEPWWILPSIIGNLLALTWALFLQLKGPKLINHNAKNL